MWETKFDNFKYQKTSIKQPYIKGHSEVSSMSDLKMQVKFICDAGLKRVQISGVWTSPKSAQGPRLYWPIQEKGPGSNGSLE